jgi:hypothetical protein
LREVEDIVLEEMEAQLNTTFTELATCLMFCEGNWHRAWPRYAFTKYG